MAHVHTDDEQLARLFGESAVSDFEEPVHHADLIERFRRNTAEPKPNRGDVAFIVLAAVVSLYFVAELARAVLR